MASSFNTVIIVRLFFDKYKKCMGIFTIQNYVAVPYDIMVHLTFIN